MKIYQQLCFALSNYMFAAILFSSFAAATIHHGSICNSLELQNAKNLLKNSKGVQNIGKKAIKVICPLIANHEGATVDTSNTDGGVLVDYRTNIPFSTSMTCTLYSYEFFGSFLGSVTNTSGFNSYITLNGVPVNIWTNHNVVCTLQPFDRIIAIESGV